MALRLKGQISLKTQYNNLTQGEIENMINSICVYIHREKFNQYFSNFS